MDPSCSTYGYTSITNGLWHSNLTYSHRMPVSTRTRDAAKAARKHGISNGMKEAQEERERQEREEQERKELEEKEHEEQEDRERKAQEHKEREVRRMDSGYLRGDDEASDEGEVHAGSKRKKSSAPDTDNKSAKTSSSQHPTSRDPAGPTQILKFLLSDESLPLCRPADENEFLEKHADDEPITYSQLLTPFEELLCAVVLSRPISHKLGLRTIRTILNAPYSLRDSIAIKTAGSEKIQQALDDAHTQHKGKTAEEIELIAKVVAENDWHNDLSRLREECKDGGMQAEREMLRKSIKGLGETGLDIFYRRVQWMWEEAFPFIDKRTKEALENLGLPSDEEKLLEIIAGMRVEVDMEGEDEKASEEEAKRKAFVIVLERAIGADLEKRVEEVLEAASDV